MHIRLPIFRTAKFRCPKCWMLRMLSGPAQIIDGISVMLMGGFYGTYLASMMAEKLIRHANWHYKQREEARKAKFEAALNGRNG